MYGRTKLEGEQAIRASGCHHLILRTSWVYAARGGNFARTMLRLAAERERLSVIDDQIGAPTGADLLADMTAHALRTVLAQPALGGTYHAVAAGETSWHGYARHVIEFARAAGQPVRVQAAGHRRRCPPAPSRRRRSGRAIRGWTRASCSTASAWRLPDWRIGVDRMLREVLG